MRNGRAIAARSSQTEEIVSIVSSDPFCFSFLRKLITDKAESLPAEMPATVVPVA